jgi:hypothetical protein
MNTQHHMPLARWLPLTLGQMSWALFRQLLLQACRGDTSQTQLMALMALICASVLTIAAADD